MKGRLICVMLLTVAWLLYARLAAQTDNGGLATSPWPKFAQNAGNSGRSPNVGPASAAVKWRLSARTEVACPPALTPNGEVCLAIGDRFYVLGPDGKVKYQYLTASFGKSAPAVGRDGTIYLGSGVVGRLLAIPPGPPKEGGTAEEPSLAFAWRFQAGGEIHSPPVVGPDRSIYFGCDDGNLYAVGPDGNLRWKYPTGSPIRCSPAVAPDGTIYVIGAEFASTLHAVGPNGAKKWTANLEDVAFFPALRADGSIILCSEFGQIVACGADGKRLWVYEPPDEAPQPSTGPAIGPQGEVYCGTTKGVLRALTPTGKLAWDCRLGEAAIAASPSVDSQGTVYVGTGEGELCAVGADGKVKWRFRLTSAATTPPVIGSSGLLYVGCADGSLLALGQ